MDTIEFTWAINHPNPALVTMMKKMLLQATIVKEQNRYVDSHTWYENLFAYPT